MLLNLALCTLKFPFDSLQRHRLTTADVTIVNPIPNLCPAPNPSPNPNPNPNPSVNPNPGPSQIHRSQRLP